jgi:hypothetical protein
MIGDVKLLDESIEVQGNALRCTTWDLMLDSPDRRISPNPLFRRALVHDVGDMLTVNYEGDYPGGVKICGLLKAVDGATIAGPVELPGAVHVGGGLKAEGGATLAGPVELPGAVHVGGGLKAEGGATIAGPLEMPGEVHVGGHLGVAAGAVLNGNVSMPELVHLGMTTVDRDLEVVGEVKLHGSLQVRNPAYHPREIGVRPYLELEQLVFNLQKELAGLQTKVAELEAKINP